MADRFGGTVYLGGKITQEQFDKCKKLLADCLDEEINDDGSSCFVECTTKDFVPVVEYCIQHKIALCLYWEAKYDEDGTMEYWIDGNYKQFLATNNGEIAIRLSELQEHPEMTIAKFIERMDIPDFPNFELIEKTTIKPSDFATDHLSGDALLAAKAVLSVFEKAPFGGGCKAFRTAEEWQGRGELYGTDAVLVLCHDGGDLAPVCNWDYGHYDLSEKLTASLKEAGFYYEQCTSWYSAVYRLPTVAS